jgi:membrane protease YdiL (CAAX protease family)
MIGAVGLVAWLALSRRKNLGNFGLQWKEDSLRVLRNGVLYGVALVTIISLCQWALGARVWRLHDTDGWHWIGLFFKAITGGLLIGLIEEIFFRGFFFQLFKDLWNVPASLFATNFVYAVVHFFPKNKPFVGPEPTVQDSFRIIASMFPGLFERPEIFVSILGLFLFGLALSFAFRRSGSLYLPIGIHAGAVFAIKMNRRFLPDVADKVTIFSGGKNLYDGLTGVFLLCFLGLIIILLVKSPAHRNYRKSVSLFLISLLLFAAHPANPPAFAEKAPVLSSKAKSRVLYSFTAKLSKAKATRIRGGEILKSKWSTGRHRFVSMANGGDIFVTQKALVRGKGRSSIRISALPGYKNVLAFPNVPSAKEMQVWER